MTSHVAIPLAEVLTKADVDFNDKSRAILQFLVAQATWQFYNSEIIGPGLSIDTVHFLHEQRPRGSGLFVDETMLLENLPVIEEGSEIKTQPDCAHDMIHNMPKILALGILLLEIESRKSMQKHRENRKGCPTQPFDVNIDYIIASRLVDDDEDNPHPESRLSNISSSSPLQKILPLCIQAGRLHYHVQQYIRQKKVGKAGTAIGYNKALRTVMYDEIVRPLEENMRYFAKRAVRPLLELPETSWTSPEAGIPELPSGT